MKQFYVINGETLEPAIIVTPAYVDLIYLK